MDAFNIFFSFQFLIWCVAIAAITFILTKVIENFILSNENVKMSKTDKIWKNVILPIAPIVNGVILGLLIKAFYPAEIANISSGRLFFGIAAGMLSGVVYRIVKGFITAKFPEAAENLKLEDLQKQVDVLNAKEEVKTDTSENKPK